MTSEIENDPLYWRNALKKMLIRVAEDSKSTVKPDVESINEMTEIKAQKAVILLEQVQVLIDNNSPKI